MFNLSEAIKEVETREKNNPRENNNKIKKKNRFIYILPPIIIKFK